MAIQTVKAVVGGQTYNLILNTSTGKYEATVTAPGTSSYNHNAGHYFPVSITAVDVAGNQATANDTDPSLGASLKLRVKEKVPPVAAITAPTAGARIINSQPTISFTVSDEDSGVNPDTISITVNGAVITAGITKNLAGKTYTCSYTPGSALPDGDNVVKVNAKDFDENPAAEKSVTFSVDTVAPTLSVTSPEANLITNAAACAVAGVTNDATSSPCAVTVKLNAGAAVPVTVQPDGSFAASVTLAQGQNTLVITSTDAAGKATAVTRTATLDTAPPVISKITLTPNPVDAGKTYIISVEARD